MVSDQVRMNRVAYIVVAVCLFSFWSSIEAEEGRKHTLRGTHWGMTPNEVKAVEKWRYALTDKDGSLVFAGKVRDVGSIITYKFHLPKEAIPSTGYRDQIGQKNKDGLLVEMVYTLETDKDFHDFFFSVFEEKYGKPSPPMLSIDIAATASPKYTATVWNIHDNQTRLLLLYADKGVLSIYYGNMKYLMEKERARRSEKEG